MGCGACRRREKQMGEEEVAVGGVMGRLSGAGCGTVSQVTGAQEAGIVTGGCPMAQTPSVGLAFQKRWIQAWRQSRGSAEWVPWRAVCGPGLSPWPEPVLQI